MDILIPASFEELILLLTTNVAFLGGVTVVVGEILWRIWPKIEGRARQIIMLVLPFAFAITAYLVQVLMAQNTWGVEQLYAVLLVAGQVSLGGQLVFGAAKGLINRTRPATPQNVS